MLYFVSGQKALTELKSKAASRVYQAFRPKTRRCYELLFRNFIGFCVISTLNVQSIQVQDIMAYLEYLVENGVSYNMICNNVSALKANFIMYDLEFHLLEHPCIRFFTKSLKINRPMSLVKRNIISLPTLQQLVQACHDLVSPFTFKAIFLVAFFGFLRISNIAPHSNAQFDNTRHLTRSDVEFTKSGMRITLKWSKTMQSRDKVHIITLPLLHPSPLCPVYALKRALAHYKPAPLQPLFQVRTNDGFRVVTESRLRKTLSKLNVKLGLHPHHFSFHTFRRSGASCAYNAHVPVQTIKSHGSWASDCVWTYIQQDSSRSAEIAASFQHLINAS